MHISPRLAPLAALLLLSLAPAARAQIGLSLKAGTPGLGGDLTFSLTERLNLRGGFNYLSLDTGDDSDLRYDLRLQSYPLLLDWHPANSSFRISGGIFVNQNELEESGSRGDVLVIGNGVYQVDSYTMTGTFDTLSPYLGIGWGNAAGPQRWSLNVDLGILFHGRPDFSGSGSTSNPERQDAFERDLRVEADKLEDDTDWFRVYPVIAIGVAYRF